MVTVCEVCYVSSVGEYLDIFRSDDTKPMIADVISKHLQFVTLEGIENPLICVACWTTLENFHRLYLLVEDLHRSHSDSSSSSEDEIEALKKEKSSTEMLAANYDSNELTYDEEAIFDTLCIEESASHVLDECDTSEVVNDFRGEEHEQLDTADETDNSQPEQSEDTELDNDDADDTKPPTKKIKLDKTYEDSVLESFYGAMVCQVCEPERMEQGLPSGSFDTFADLKRHMLQDHNIGRAYLQCPLCSKRQFLRYKLWQHMDMHNNPEKYRCPTCHEVHQDLEAHSNSKHKKKAFVCKVCCRGYASRNRLTNHMKITHGPKDVVCNKCNKAFNKYVIKAHMRSKHGDPEFVCEWCGKAYRNVSMLKKHKQVHLSVAPIECLVCGQEVRANYLESHIKLMHTESQPVECGSCGKSCLNRRTLRAHQNRSCPANVTRCSTCSKTFKTMAALTEHQKTHGAQIYYMCPVCMGKFESKSLLFAHQQEAHKDSK